MVNLSETLIVVTSDHSSVMTFGGISTPRGNPILGNFFNIYFTFIYYLVIHC